MANEEHLDRIKSGIDGWNDWRRNNDDVIPELTQADLRGAELTGADLAQAHLEGADMRGVKLARADLSEADLYLAQLQDTDLSEADLSEASLYKADLTGASLLRARLHEANLSEAILSGARLQEANLSYALLVRTTMLNSNLTKVKLRDTVFAQLNLSDVSGLETCLHAGRSIVDNRTLELSGKLPLPFLRGVGFSDNLIDYLPSLLSRPIEHYSCFISFSTGDQPFADRLHADLQNKGVRCWFAPHDMPIGGKILDEIDSAIRLRDKVLLILSEHSIKSDWVKDEVTKAFEEERSRGLTVLFPIRLDDAVMETNEAWAAKLRARHIGDFRRWKEHDEYQKSFARVLRDLTVKKP